MQSSGLTDSLYSGYETLTSDTHSSTERMIEGVLWVRVEGVWCRAYERISDPIDTSRAPLIRSSFGLHYSTPSTAQPAPSTPPREGRLCGNLREAYASPDDEMDNGSLPSNLSTLERPAPGSSPGAPVSGPTVPSTTLQSHAAVESPDSVNTGQPSTGLAGPNVAIDGSCNAAVGATSLVSRLAPTVSFPRPDEATLEAACTSLYLDLLQAHEKDPLAPFLLLLRFLPIETIFDAVLAQCTTERQRIMVTNNILRLWHLASTDLPNDSILARPRRGAAPVSSQDTGGSLSFTCTLQVSHCFLHEHVHWQGLWRSPLTLRRRRAYLSSLPNRPPITCNQLPGPLDAGVATGCDAELLLAKVSPLLGCPSLGPSVVFLIHGGGPSSQPSADIGRSRCLWTEVTPNSLCLATAVGHCSLHGVYQSTSVYVCRSITVIPNNKWFNNTVPFMWHPLGCRLLLLRHALRYSTFRTQGPAHRPSVPAETVPKFPKDNLPTVGHCLPPSLPGVNGLSWLYETQATHLCKDIGLISLHVTARAGTKVRRTPTDMRPRTPAGEQDTFCWALTPECPGCSESELLLTVDLSITTWPCALVCDLHYGEHTAPRGYRDHSKRLDTPSRTRPWLPQTVRTRYWACYLTPRATQSGQKDARAAVADEAEEQAHLEGVAALCLPHRPPWPTGETLGLLRLHRPPRARPLLLRHEHELDRQRWIDHRQAFSSPVECTGPGTCYQGRWCSLSLPGSHILAPGPHRRGCLCRVRKCSPLLLHPRSLRLTHCTFPEAYVPTWAMLAGENETPLLRASACCMCNGVVGSGVQYWHVHCTACQDRASSSGVRNPTAQRTALTTHASSVALELVTNDTMHVINLFLGGILAPGWSPTPVARLPAFPMTIRTSITGPTVPRCRLSNVRQSFWQRCVHKLAQPRHALLSRSCCVLGSASASLVRPCAYQPLPQGSQPPLSSLSVQGVGVEVRKCRFTPRVWYGLPPLISPYGRSMDVPLVTMEANPGGANDASRRPPRSRKKADGTRRRTQGEKEARAQRPDKRARAEAAAAAKGKAKAKQQAAGRYTGTWEAMPTTPQEWQWSEQWDTTWSRWSWQQSGTLDEQEDGRSFDWIADPNVDTAQNSSSTDQDDDGTAPLLGSSTARPSRNDAVASRPWHLGRQQRDRLTSTDPADLDHSLQGLPLETRSIYKAEDAEPTLDDWAAEVQATATVDSSEDELWSEKPPGGQSDRHVEAPMPRTSVDDQSSGASSPELLAEDAARRVRDTLATLPGGIRRALGQLEPGSTPTGLHPSAHTEPSSSSGYVHEETPTQPPPTPSWVRQGEVRSRGTGKSASRPRRETVSRALTAILRHDVDGANLLRADGFLPLHALLRLPTAKRHSLTHDEIVTECSVNEKNRFQLSDDGKAIRAVQGHSIKVQPDLLMSTLTEADLPPLLLHGTAHKHYISCVYSRMFLFYFN